MAELNGDTPGATASPGLPGSPVDPRAVRVRLAPTSAQGGEAPCSIAPVDVPLRMTNPTVGVGVLGGAALPAVTPSEPGVLAQRQVLVDGEVATASLEGRGNGRHVLRDGASSVPVILGPEAGAPGGARRREVLVDGFRLDVEVEPERIAALRERATRGRASSATGGPLEVRAIIPGKVVGISVASGDAVVAGQQLLVVEAMKMQNELRAPRDGTVERVGVGPGEAIEVGDLLVVIS